MRIRTGRSTGAREEPLRAAFAPPLDGRTPPRSRSAGRVRLAASALGLLLAPTGLAGTALGLTDRQLAGQRVVFAFPGASPPAALLARIHDGAAGAVILFRGNVSGVAGTRGLADALQEVPRPADVDEPLLVMTDQEGGRVRRLAVPPAAPAAALGALGAVAVGAQGRAAGRGLERAGVNVDLAPVADVARPEGLIDRQERAFGGAPAPVASRAAAFAAGLGGTGVAACAKHFPGLGAAATSTDDGPVSVDASLQELRRVDEAPFARLIREGVPMVMVSTAVYPALGGLPAALSRRVIAGELRRRLGFSGVVVTDALDTPALGPPDAVGTAAVRAARAGADLILVSSPAAGDRAADALAAALSAGRLDRSAFRRSVDRVLALRARLAPSQVPFAARR